MFFFKSISDPLQTTNPHCHVNDSYDNDGPRRHLRKDPHPRYIGNVVVITVFHHVLHLCRDGHVAGSESHKGIQDASTTVYLYKLTLLEKRYGQLEFNQDNGDAE